MQYLCKKKQEKIEQKDMKKILGMGNALTDILLQIQSDEVLLQLNLPKGSMQLVDAAKINEIRSKVDLSGAAMAAGGSASNTINGLTKLGIPAGFIGKISKDTIGDFFLKDTLKNGAKPHLMFSSTASGNCTVLVSPDGERTLCTFLGASAELTPDDLSDELFLGYDIFHIEGYLVQNHELILKAIQLAKANGLFVSIDLASYNVVEANLDFLKTIIADYVDIVFANEEEARAFTGKEPLEALIHIAGNCEIAVVKIGKEGSYVKSGDNDHHTIAPYLAESIDTTGAGDLYASGFLYGLALDLPHDICGKIGSLVSARVVEVLGAKMSDQIWGDIHAEIKNIVSK